MGALIATIVNFARRLFQFFLNIWDVFVSWIYVVWDASMRVIDVLLSLFVQVFVFLAQFLADTLIFILWLAVSILPSMPDGPELSGVGGIISQSNRYIPVGELAALSGVWAAIFAAIGLYKMAKFVRGAG